MTNKQFESLIGQLSDQELACYIKELARANNTQLIEKIISDTDYYTPQHVLFASFEFKETYQGSDFWKSIFHRLK